MEGYGQCLVLVDVFGTISREEGWEEWVLLLPPGVETWGASFPGVV